MVTPYKNVRAGPKDDFNFFHSQLQINIERAFGMLVKRWAVLAMSLEQFFLDTLRISGFPFRFCSVTVSTRVSFWKFLVLFIFYLQ
jgi:hypothetical protein